MFKMAFNLLAAMMLAGLSTPAQIPPGYYNGTAQLSGTALKAALHEIINDHQAQTYAQLWQHFILTDQKPNGKVWDMYSDIPNGTAAYEYTFVTDQCGNYNSEGDCYNREHSFPASWFDDQLPMYTDLFHIVPTDGYVNNKRSNFPYGEVGQASWTSTNGSRLGSSATPGYSGTAFEPVDAYKGDLARGIMYMSTRYYNEDANWPGSDMTLGADLMPWAKTLLLQWHTLDPVSQKEIDRNNAVYQIQQNRNPFIDHPEFAGLIWDPTAGTDAPAAVLNVKLWPNPATESVSVAIDAMMPELAYKLIIHDLSGRTVFSMSGDLSSTVLKINTSDLQPGCYFVSLSGESHAAHTQKLILK